MFDFKYSILFPKKLNRPTFFSGTKRDLRFLKQQMKYRLAYSGHAFKHQSMESRSGTKSVTRQSVLNSTRLPSGYIHREEWGVACGSFRATDSRTYLRFEEKSTLKLYVFFHWYQAHSFLHIFFKLCQGYSHFFISLKTMISLLFGFVFWFFSWHFQKTN